MPNHVFRYRCLRDRNAKFHQFPMDARSTPTRVGETHSPDEVSDFTRYRRTTCAMATLPSPIQPESLSMPADDGFRLHDNQCGSPISPQPGKPNPEDAVSGIEAELMTTAGTLQNQELMTKGKDFSLQSCPSSEAGWHGEKQRDEEGKHGSGSLLTPAVQIQLSQ